MVASLNRIAALASIIRIAISNKGGIFIEVWIFISIFHFNFHKRTDYVLCLVLFIPEASLSTANEAIICCAKVLLRESTLQVRML
ncbi:hypothetical protein M433DRAFT_331489 [Acidomyces richmondensis BFW]|nr:MAG: hypothetical protein FE78DRAFT_512548 [Acidomyces sp. 'richmondensis']KYG49232.1 hypothetical protein M433DRAFT_331489 [Acidomyces richmondensis BFW]